MSRNASGVCSRTKVGGYIPDQDILAIEVNIEVDDIITMLSDSLSRSGKGAMQANLAAGGYKVTGLGTATTAGDAVEYDQYNTAITGKAALGVNTDITSLAGGTVLSSTPAPGDNSKKIINSEFVVLRFAPIDSPVFTNNPKAPTQPITDNDTSIASTAFVNSAGWFESAEQNIASANYTLAHGLGRIPKQMIAVLRCKTADIGYAVDDEVVNFVINSGAGYYVPASVYVDSANVGCWLVNQMASFNKSTGAYANLTIANWKLVLRCR